MGVGGQDLGNADRNEMQIGMAPGGLGGCGGGERFEPLSSWSSSHFHTRQGSGCLPLALPDPPSNATVGDP